MATRADRIEEILMEAGGRLKVLDIQERLAHLEDALDLHPATVSATVRQDNKTRDARGEAPRFKHFGDGNEERGYISLVEQEPEAVDVSAVVKNFDAAIPAVIQEANKQAKDLLKQAISNLDWREFESNFLRQVLEALGFTDVEITQPTRDGGKDALCTYRRGLVTSEAIVSAKHWKTKDVGPEAVRELRGIVTNADTGIIVTSANFTDVGKGEATPAPNFRSVVLIDGDLIVDTCLKNSIGVTKLELPTVYRFTGLKKDDTLE